MAPPVCSFCEQEYGMLMATDINDGDTKVVGASCLIGYALSMAVAVTTGISPELAQRYGESFDAIAKNDPRTTAKPKRARSTATRPAEQDTTDTDASVPPAPIDATPGMDDRSDAISGDVANALDDGDYDDMHQADESDTG